MWNRVRSLILLRPAILPSLAALVVLMAGCGGSGSRAAAPPPSPSATTSPTVAPSAPATVAAQAHRYTVAISAGHGGPNNIGAAHENAQGHVDLVEKELTLDVARRLNALLLADGYRTVMIRDGDYSLATIVPGNYTETVRRESQARADKANAAGADIILAIHFNGGDPTQSGTAVYYNPDRSFGEESKVLATSIYDAIIAHLHALGYDARRWGVLNDTMTAGGALAGGHTFLLGESAGFRWTQMPGMIGEALFVTNDTEAALLQRDAVRQAIAQAYKDGIDQYFSWLSGQRRQG